MCRSGVCAVRFPKACSRMNTRPGLRSRGPGTALGQSALGARGGAPGPGSNTGTAAWVLALAGAGSPPAPSPDAAGRGHRGTLERGNRLRRSHRRRPPRVASLITHGNGLSLPWQAPWGRVPFYGRRPTSRVAGGTMSPDVPGRLLNVSKKGGNCDRQSRKPRWVSRSGCTPEVT